MNTWRVMPLLAVLVGVSSGPVLGQQDPSPVVSTHPQPAAAAESLNGFDEFVRMVMEEFDIPGVAVAAIQDGEIVISKGWGYRNVEEQLPMTDETLLAIGSNSKSFTAMVLGTLVDEGKIEWDEPVKTYLPDFNLYDDAAEEAMTVRDIISHRSGLPRHDRLWSHRSTTRQEIFERLQYLEPTVTHRARWQYQNLMFMTAGLLGARVTGKSWEENVRERIFEPLGMYRSNFSVDDSQRDANHALPYQTRDDVVQPVPFHNIDQIGPAGSINSSVDMMIRYIQMNIDEGVYNGKRIISEEVAREMQIPHSQVPGEPDFEKKEGYGGYGLALWVTTYQGRKMVRHGGGIDGFISQMAWMPHAKIGVMVLTNYSGFNPVPNMLMHNVFDRLLGVEEVDWFAAAKENREAARTAREEREKKRADERHEGTSPSHTWADYAGTYEHPAYGTVIMHARQAGLHMVMDQWSGNLNHYHYDVFEVEADGPGQAIDNMLVSFGYTTEGEVDRFMMPLESNVGDIVFTRRKAGN